MSESIAVTEARLREAIQAQNFALAQYLLKEYCGQVEDAVRRREGDWQRYLEETPKLLSWARLAALASRAHHMSELASIPSLRGYLPNSRQHRWAAEL